jgi:hypothetical protein
MLNQNQSSINSNQDEINQNAYPKPQPQPPEQNPISISQQNSKYSSNRPYQSQMDFRNSSNRERSRSNEHSPRQSYHDYRPGNSNKLQGRNSFNIDNRNNKPYYYRQNNERQFDSNRYKKERNQFGENNFNSGYNNNYGPTKDDCLIVLPKNYYNFIAKDFDNIKNDLKRELKDDIYNINFNYSVPSIPEKIFRFTTNYSNNFPLKTKAIKIITDFLFENMKRQYEKTTYLKLIFLIPDNVIGFIIGINGKNINQMRDETNTKIEVFAPNSTKKYRKVEVAGTPQDIAEAGEKIYEITRKYFYFNDEKLNRNENDHDGDYDRRGSGFGMGNSFKDRDQDRKDRYYESNWNKDYDIDRYNNNREYKGIYNKERNDFRDLGYKNDFKNREGSRFYPKNSRDFWDKNNNGRDNNNYRDFRDNGPRFRNNYDNRGNNSKYFYDKNKNKNINNDNNNDDSKQKDNWSNKSYSRKSSSEKSKEHRSFNDGNDEWPEEKEFKNEENKINNNEHLDNDNIELGNEKDFKEKDYEINNDLNEEQIELKKNLENGNVNEFIDKDNNLEVSNIQNNNLIINNIIKERNDYEREKGEIDDLNNELPNEVEEKDKLCKIIVYLSSEEFNLLNNSEKDNIWNNLENNYQCNISKTTKNIDNQEISLISFNGTPNQNSLAIYQLQKYLLEIKNEKLDANKSNN